MKNLAKAIQVSFQAATFATEQIAFDVAIRYFKNAQFLLRQSAKGNIAVPIDPVKVEMAFGDVLMLTGKNEQALKMFQTLLEDGNHLDQYQVLDAKYKIGSIYHNMGVFERSIPFFKGALSDLKKPINPSRTVIVFLLLLEVAVQIAYSLGLKRLLRRKDSNLAKLELRILNKLSYSLYFTDMFLGFYVHFKALNLADKFEDCYEKIETYSFHGAPAYMIFLRKRSFQYLNNSLKMAQKIHRRDSYALVEYVAGAVCYYSTKWSKGEKALKECIATYGSLGDLTSPMQAFEHLWKIYFSQGEFEKASQVMNRTIDLCRKNKEKHFLMSTLAASHFIELIQNSSVIKNELSEVEDLLKQVDSYLSHSHVGGFLLPAELLEGKLTQAYKRAIDLVKIILKGNVNSEYNVPIFSYLVELIILEFRNRRLGNGQLVSSASKLSKNLFCSFSFLAFSCLSYPAYRGSYYRSRAWWHALKGRKKKAHRFFQRAIKSHHSLDMRYEEARSIRDYANFLEDFCNLPGEARDKYNEAYRLFEWCGAKLETDRIKDKVDISHVQSMDNSIVPGDQTSVNPQTTSFRTVAGVNQIRVDTLYDLSNSIQNIDDTNELLHKILRSMITATGAQFGGFFAWGKDGNPERSIFMDFEGKNLSEENVTFSKEIVDKVKSTQQVVMTKDGLKELGLAGVPGKEIRSVLCIPLGRNQAFHGCVYLGNNMVTGLFSEDSKKTALIIASEAGILLENAYLMDSYKRLNRDLQKKVREQTTDIREKNKQLEEYTLRITDSERMKGLLGGTIVHDIKNYAAGIEGNITLLSRQLSEEQKVQKTAKIVTDCCSSIVSLASNMLDITKMEEGKLVLKKEMLTKNAIFSMASQLSGGTMLEEKGITVSFQDNSRDQFAIDADCYLVERVLQNLFNNAAKYVPRNGTVVLSLEGKGEDNILSFFSSGAPIPDEDKTLLFDKYARIESASSQYSKGLGLFFCKMVMSAHGGRIWLETNEKGNCFRLAFKKKFMQSIFSPAA